MEQVFERDRSEQGAPRRHLGLAAVAVAVLLSLAAVACSSSNGDSSSPDGTGGGEGSEQEDVPQPDPVAITVTATLVGTQVQLQGTATVPDGAKVSYEMRHPSLTDPAVCQAAGVSCLAVGAVPAQAGAWSATVDVSSWPAGEVPVWAGFQMNIGMEEGQPTEIIELYGEHGERITGESVIQVGEETHAEARTTVLVP